MDEQQLLDEQLFYTVPENLDPTVHLSPNLQDESDPSFDGSTTEHGAISKGDQIAASVMNSLSLGKPIYPTSERLDKEILSISPSDSSSESRTAASSEPLTTQSRKRKTSESPARIENPKKNFRGTNGESMRVDPARSKLASGQLNRPTTNPLTIRHLHASVPVVAHDKFAIVVDSVELEAPTKANKRSTQHAMELGGSSQSHVNQQELERKSLKPNGEEKGRRGRPPKATTNAADIKKVKVTNSLNETVARMVLPSSRQSARQRGMEPEMKDPADVVVEKSVSPKCTTPPVLRRSPQKKAKTQRSVSREGDQHIVVPSIHTDDQQRYALRSTSVQQEQTVLGSPSDREDAGAVSAAEQSNKALLPHSPAPSQRVVTRRMQADGPLPGSKTVLESVGASQDDEVNELGDMYFDDEEAGPSEYDSDDPQDNSSDPELAEETVPGGTAEGSKEPEIEDAESDEEEIPHANEEDGLMEDLELFEGRDLWETVLEGARTVGVSKVKGEETRRRPKMATTIVKDFVALVNGAESIYRQLVLNDLAVADEEDIEQRLYSRQDDIDHFVDNLSEDKASDDKGAQSLLIQDIYTHAVPAMVFMLEAALCCRSVQYADPEDVETLEEIVHIQAKIVQLCEKARGWQAKPITKRPIKNSVTGRILPGMRDLKLKHFGRELEQRRDSASARAKERKLAESHRRRLHRIQQAKMDQKQRKADNLKSWPDKHLQFPTRQSVVNRHFQQAKPPVKPHQFRHHATADRWTNEQNRALVDELQSEKTRHLPAQERYLAILNHPLLQNKLPEHIHNRALFYRALILDEVEELRDKDYVLSIQ